MSGFTVLRAIDYDKDLQQFYIGTRTDRNGAQAATFNDVTVNDLVEILDMDAEDQNYHDFIGWAQVLADSITKNDEFSRDGADLAKRVLWDIACRGGWTEGVR